MYFTLVHVIIIIETTREIFVGNPNEATRYYNILSSWETIIHCSELCCIWYRQGSKSLQYSTRYHCIHTIRWCRMFRVNDQIQSIESIIMPNYVVNARLCMEVGDGHFRVLFRIYTKRKHSKWKSRSLLY